MTGETPGHRLARDELLEVQSLSAGRPLALRVEAAGTVADGWLPIEVSLDCADIPARQGQVRLDGREHAVVLIPAHFPFSRPGIEVTHDRFAGLPYVLLGHQICLYHSDSDWNPADGMFGFTARLTAWYRRAAQGRLVAEGQALHPPLAYPFFGDPDCLVIHPDLPADFEPAAAVVVRRNRWRADVVEWLRPAALNLAGPGAVGRLKSRLSRAASDHGGTAFLGAVTILHEPLSFELPTTFPGLAAALSAQHVSQEGLVEHLAQIWLANLLTAGQPDTATPLYVVLGAPMRGFARAGGREMHLAVWQLAPGEAVLPSILTFSGTGEGGLAAWLPAAQQQAREWLRTAPITWALVQEARRQIVTRRDTGKPAQWLLGKTVLVLGCGALGARIAEHCVRAGVAGLTVADAGVVSPGLLVRQPYDEADIGIPKALCLADRLAAIRPRASIKILAETGDIRRTILGSDSACPDADLVVDATANRGVSARIEWLRRRQRPRWPPTLTVGVGHECERAIGALALPQATGAGTDILHSFADRAVREDALRDAAQDFFAAPDAQRIFQPEVGCSEPTFTGSDPEVAAAAGQVFAWALHVLSEHAAHRPIATKSLLFTRLPGRADRPASVCFEWPDDVTAEDRLSGYQVRIRPRAMADMRAEALTTARLYPPSWETGGILLGYFDGACRVAWVVAAAGPSSDSQRGDHAFWHGTEGVAALVARHHRDSRGRSRFIGMWHTHPEMSPQASPIDYRAMGDLFGPTGAGQVPRQAIQLVLGGGPGRWDRWLRGAGEPEVSVELFRRSQVLASIGTARPLEQEH
jgi:integrative and conjugative element protein (TIGR02256 family)